MSAVAISAFRIRNLSFLADEVAKIEARFLAFVSPEPMTGCWLWTGCVCKSGYGSFRVKGQIYRAHRVAFVLWRGQPQEGLVSDHLCRVRSCVNPFHLEMVDLRTNTLRGLAPSAINASLSLCRRGHPLFGANLRMEGSGRRCRTCERDRQRAAAHSTWEVKS